MRSLLKFAGLGIAGSAVLGLWATNPLAWSIVFVGVIVVFMVVILIIRALMALGKALLGFMFRIVVIALVCVGIVSIGAYGFNRLFVSIGEMFNSSPTSAVVTMSDESSYIDTSHTAMSQAIRMCDGSVSYDLNSGMYTCSFDNGTSIEFR